ncbi:SRPBCC domain-containing protein [Sphaerotilus mobilis]|uniref:Activator of Hsp90 ATPase-like protein n=1 Tax=Sphaerotilus mobilis TaxID=47994 RepID=A0A4Q7LRX0_9BURK|nr:SRPBCC domain-containing protein [Sphaerotilus mobilis]RZS56957.1 hypothetical protein EV685_1515 [Sphaerotilus mobilis]
MKTTLEFSLHIAAPRSVVWQHMLTDAGYRDWTSVFCAGSYFLGSWHVGAEIRFLSPGGDGMVAEIAEHRLHERVSIRHLGDIVAGVEDRDSERARSIYPAYETYETFDMANDGEGTLLRVCVDAVPEFEAFLSDTYPKALQRLKAICEGLPH